MFNSVSGVLHIEGTGIALDIVVDKTNLPGISLAELPAVAGQRVQRALESLSSEADKAIAKEKLRADKAEEKLAKLVTPSKAIVSESVTPKKELLPKATASLISDDDIGRPVRRK